GASLDHPVSAPPGGDPAAIRAEGDALDRAHDARPLKGESAPAGPGVPDVDLDVGPGGAISPGGAGRGGDPGAIRADRKGQDCKGVFDVGQAVEVDLSHDVVPLPAAESFRAKVKFLLGPRGIVLLHLVESEVDLLDVVSPCQLLALAPQVVDRLD